MGCGCGKKAAVPAVAQRAAVRPQATLYEVVAGGVVKFRTRDPKAADERAAKIPGAKVRKAG